MNLKDLFSGDGKRVRYAVVALGDISQGAMLPGIAHTGNSEVTAFVTGDAEKAKELGNQYGVDACYPYERFDELCASGKIDAIYLATPNWRHAEFAIPALNKGIHVLCEKPLEISVELCQKIADAQKQSRAKLMVAYRLHFEPATLAMIERLRAGDLGELRYFSSVFSQMVDPKNHRAHAGEKAGPLFDMGAYPINATRYVFGDEPTEVVSACELRYDDSLLADSPDTVAVTLKFPRGRLAQFTVSYSAAAINALTVVGTKGSLELNPAFTYGKPLEHFVQIGDTQTHRSFKVTDQFGGEMKYFSNCILNDLNPEPDVGEGLADVRVIEGILRAIRSGRAETLPPFTRTKRIDFQTQLETLSKVSKPRREVNASSPGLGG